MVIYFYLTDRYRGKQRENTTLTSELSLIENKEWYAVYVRSRHEKVVYQSLIEKNIECSLPLIKQTRQWSDRKKKVEVPLFRGYIFVHINLTADKFTVLQIEGVVKYIGVSGSPSVIDKNQMYWLNSMIDLSDTIQHEEEIPLGDKVKVVTGPFKGLEGTVIQRKNKTRLVIVIDSIMQAASIEIDPEYLQRL